MVKHLYDNCGSGFSEACVLSPTDAGKGEVVLAPSENIHGVEIFTSIFSNGGVKKVHSSRPDANLVAGKEHVLFASGGASPDMQGKFFTGQWEIVRNSDRLVALCNRADFYVM